jgi:hypothetical protein
MDWQKKDLKKIGFNSYFVLMKKLLYLVFVVAILFAGCKKSSSTAPDPQIEINKKMTAFVEKLESGSGRWLLAKDNGIYYDSDGKGISSFEDSGNSNRFSRRFVHYNQLDFTKLIYEIHDNNKPSQPVDPSEMWELDFENGKFIFNNNVHWQTEGVWTFENIENNSFDLISEKLPLNWANEPKFAYMVRTYHFEKMQ